MSWEVRVGDCLDVLPTLEPASVDAIVTDPPYVLGFMGKAWDRDHQHDAWARAAYRVLKPGGHVAAFGGTRTSHRLACALEDAGFEIRDSLLWLYGSGFPKSLDVSKAIDRQRDDRHDIERVVRWLESVRSRSGVTRAEVEQHFGSVNIGQALFTITPGSSPRVATWDQWQSLRVLLKFGDEMDAEVWRLNGRKGTPGEAWERREVTGTAGQMWEKWEEACGNRATARTGERRDIPATEAAEQWQGWGTALKPAHEPIILARKPLAGTVAANVQAHGTGALNVDGCRVGTDGGGGNGLGSHFDRLGNTEPRIQHGADATGSIGRWPPNVLLTHGACCGEDCGPCCPVAELDQQSGPCKTGDVVFKRESGADSQGNRGAAYGAESRPSGTRMTTHIDNESGASCFFPRFRYEAKASSSEREAGLHTIRGASGGALGQVGDRRMGRSAEEGANTRERQHVANHHPTVKPIDLMRWLCRLLTPPGGLVLDPFTGSGTTGIAALREGFRFLGIEREPDYAELARTRIGEDAPLFQREVAP